MGVQQNFFGLGGHSLLAIEILCRIRKQFSVGLSINDFFTKPTVAQQAALVSERLAGDGCNGEIIRPNPTGPGLQSLPSGREALEAILLQRRNTLGEGGADSSQGPFPGLPSVPRSGEGLVPRTVAPGTTRL